MSATNNTKIKIAFIGKFTKLHDEEYIARSFEMLGHEVSRIPQHLDPFDIEQRLLTNKPDILIYTKWEQPKVLDKTISELRRNGMKTVCWLFDLYFDYHREFQVKNASFFKSDYVFTTDNGHSHRWKELGINHQCVRQGIFKDECVLLPFDDVENDVIFVGSDNPVFPERRELVKAVEGYNFRWYGKRDTNEVRGMALNVLFSRSKIVVGDSFYSPNYWSNRVVETLGRGGFLIHQEVEGLKEEYPYLVTYKKGDFNDLREKIDYYLAHEDERREIVRKNFEWVRGNYTMDKKCAELISKI